ncbi:MAG TPA: glycoside hydrolase family 140 protein [Clostridia bacterium]|nr:glycoside hydrolase family 140 protein [Clostridia bacterium]
MQKVRVSSNNRFLVQEDGKQFFYLADTAWELFHRLNREEVERYLSDRAAKGFTVIQAVALAELDGLTVPNRFGFLPLAERDPSRPDTKPGPGNDYWDFVDEVIALAEEKGLYVGLLPTWGKYVTPDAFNGKVDGIFNPTNAQVYGQFLGARYKDRRNIIWILGGDKAPSTPEALAIWRAMAKGIAIGVAGKEDFSACLMTYHTSGPGNASDYVHDEPWLDFTGIQSSHGDRIFNWHMIEANYRRQPTKPVLDLESSYPDAWIRTEWVPQHLRSSMTSRGPSNDDHARRAAYWSIFSGACGHTYGHNSIWQMMSPGRGPVLDAKAFWYDALNAPSAAQMGLLRALIESRPYQTQVPDQTLLASEPGNDVDHLAALRGDGYAMIYTPTGKPFRVRLDKLTGKRVKAYWFDPRTGKCTKIGGFARKGEREFNPPGEPAIGNDWVLMLEDPRRGLKPPRIAFGPNAR